MASQKVVVVTELAPKLKEFDGPDAMRFLREYEAYENRLDDEEAKVQMKQCIEPDDLEALLLVENVNLQCRGKKARMRLAQRKAMMRVRTITYLTESFDSPMLMLS